MICKKCGVDMGDGKEIKFCFQWGGLVAERETEKTLIKSKDKSYKSRLKTILLTSLAVVLAVGGGYVAIHAKCRVVVGKDGNCYVEDGLFEKRGDVKSLKVPKGATGIGDEAFYQCWSLRRVSLPEGLTSIGDQAFCECWRLSSVSLPESLTSIGNEAFYACSSLSRVSLPEGLTSIGDGAFSWCDSLTSIDLPESVTSIGDEAFVIRA
jgi:hypothetical protein